MWLCTLWGHESRYYSTLKGVRNCIWQINRNIFNFVGHEVQNDSRMSKSKIVMGAKMNSFYNIITIYLILEWQGFNFVFLHFNIITTTEIHFLNRHLVFFKKVNLLVLLHVNTTLWQSYFLLLIKQLFWYALAFFSNTQLGMHWIIIAPPDGLSTVYSTWMIVLDLANLLHWHH